MRTRISSKDEKTSGECCQVVQPGLFLYKSAAQCCDGSDSRRKPRERLFFGGEKDSCKVQGAAALLPGHQKLACKYKVRFADAAKVALTQDCAAMPALFS